MKMAIPLGQQGLHIVKPGLEGVHCAVPDGSGSAVFTFALIALVSTTKFSHRLI